MIIVLIICLTIYVAMIFSVKYRTAIASVGIGVLLLYGTISGTYSASEAFQTFPLEIVILVITLALFSKIFENNGFFKIIGDKFVELSKGRKIFIAITLPFVMYATSLFMNNLSVILLFTFICLTLAIRLKLPIVPILVSGLIASNIGGAALPWADTPAVILTLYTNFSLFDFLSKVFLPCAINTGLLILYTVWWFKHEEKKAKCNDNAIKPLNYKNPLGTAYHHTPHEPKHHFTLGKHRLRNTPPPPPPLNTPPHLAQIKHTKYKKIYLPIILFILFILSICLAPFFNISIAFVGMFFIGITLFITIDRPEEILNSLPILDSLTFISALFMISGALEHYGILKVAVDYVLSFTGDNKILIVLAIMICAFIIATFLSAGPAAATILPMCLYLAPLVGNNIVYAALAFGILAGSSMLPWSATGGPVMLSEVDRFLHSNKVLPEDKVAINEIYNLKHYISFSIPFSLVILVVGGIFLILYTLFL